VQVKEDLLKGTVEMHVHLRPDIVPRLLTERELVTAALAAGYSGVLLKNAAMCNVTSAVALDRDFTEIRVFGGIVLNRWVGGLNPDAVASALILGGKMVWMPTYHAWTHLKVQGKPLPTSAPKELSWVEGTPIRILDGGELLPEVTEILDLVAKSDAILGTGHLSFDEIKPLVTKAQERCVDKILVTHAEWNPPGLSVQEQQWLVDEGVFIEHAFTPCMPCYMRLNPNRIAEAVRAVGSENCVMSTDFGQLFNPHPIEGMRMFIQTMLRSGLTQNEVVTMTSETPSTLLGIK
jgi:hypothetical protein